MLRILLLVLLAGLGAVRASDKIEAPTEGASTAVSQPHVVAELIPESTTVEAGKPFDVALHLHMDEGWHTYWINPGDAGLATTIKWTLPPGFTAGPIRWPVPEKHPMGPLMTYGYAGDAYLLTTITPAAKGDLPQHFDLKAKAEWLVCKEECIPGKAELTLPLDSGFMNLRLPVENTELFKEARGRLPVPNTAFNIRGYYLGSAADAQMVLVVERKSGPWPPETSFVHTEFFPEQNNVLDGTKPPGFEKSFGAVQFFMPVAQNGEKPDKLSGVLVSDQPLIGDAKAVQIAEFPVTSGSAQPTVAGAGPAPVGTNVPISGAQNATPAASANATEPGAGPAPATLQSNAGEPAGQRPAATTAGATTVAATAQPLLIAVLGAAFVGGLILNLMPCVLPVLSLKVFALIRHAGDNPKAAWRQGAAFTAGVVVSFWALGGLLLVLRAAGNHLGWGFQMQSPGFVAGLIVLFFLIGLNLFGVFEIGGSLVGLDQKAASHAGGSVSSFLNGALATLAATPCTAPFMGSALGFAAQQPAFVSMLIFTFLALGMAAPYLLLTIFPQSLRFVPKPGAWMESLKQFMGFLLMGTVIFLIYVFGALKSSNAMVGILGVLLLVSIAAWIYGRWGNPARTMAARITGGLVCVAFLIGATVQTVALVNEPGAGPAPATLAADGWQDWSPDAVQAALAKGQPVFVDFTAAWCLSCKVNERVALGTDAVKQAFAGKNVALFRADWTRQDPVISQTLQKFNRDGVPLYLLYSPKSPDAPQVLPEVLTPGTVLDALGKI